MEPVAVTTDIPRRPPAPWRRHLLAILVGTITGALVGTLGEIVSAGPAGG